MVGPSHRLDAMATIDLVDEEKVAFLFGNPAVGENLDDPGLRRRLIEELYGIEDPSPAGSMSRFIYSQVAEQILSDDPPEVWQTALRLSAQGRDSKYVMSQLALASTSALVEAVRGIDRENPEEINIERFRAALDRLPLPPLAEVMDLLVAVASANRQIPSGELCQQVLARLGSVGDEWEVEQWVEQVFEQMLDMRSDLMMIPPDRVVHPQSLFSGAIFTHRLRPGEKENGRLEAGVDLFPLRWMGAPLLLPTGEEVEVEEGFDGSEVWEGPDGWLDGRSKYGRFEDAGHVEPLAADPDSLAGVDAVDPEALRGSGAEHGDGFSGACRVEVVALGHAGGDHRKEAEGCGLANL